MKLKTWHYIVIIAAMLILGHLKLNKDQETEPLFPTRGQVFLAKADQENVQYFHTHDKYVYSELSRWAWEKVNWIPMGQWKYRAVVTGNTTHIDGMSTPLTGKNTCIVQIYDGYIEVNGVTYLPPEGYDVVRTLDSYWDNRAQDFTVYTVS